jgi:hypothetical protein
MRVVLLAALGACGYSPTPTGPATDASPGGDGTIAGEDAESDGGQQLTLIETMTIPVANGAETQSQMSLAAGTVYTLRASGTFVIDNVAGTLGDAEYYDFSQQTPFDVTPIGTPVDVGIGIDDPMTDGSKKPTWGAFDMMHTYEAEFTGKGAPIRANIHDGNYANDTGSLTLEIFVVQ